MATTSVPEEMEPITPAGDVDDVIAALADVELDDDGDDDEEGVVLPELDAAFDDLAAAVDAPEPTTADGDDAAGDADESTAADRFQRDRADFETVKESTDVDSIPYENAAAFLANTLYAVPPANTRFQWADVPEPTPDWTLDEF